MVNATEMAKSFGKAAKDWLKTQQSRDFISAVSEVKKILSVDLVRVTYGDNGGTWMHEDVALEFARWLSPRFAIWCNDRVKELISKSYPKPTGHRSPPRTRSDYRAWYEVVSPWLGYEEVGRVAVELGVTVCHVRKVLRGTSASQSVIDALGLVAYDNHNRGHHPPKRRSRVSVDYQQTLDLFGWARIEESEVVL